MTRAPNANNQAPPGTRSTRAPGGASPYKRTRSHSGKTGIRTLGTQSDATAFETARFVHSRTLPTITTIALVPRKPPPTWYNHRDTTRNGRKRSTMHSKTSPIIAATFAALAVLLIAAFGISAQTDPLSATTTAAATGNRDDSEEAANTLTSAQTITLTAHNIRGQWSWTIETGGQTVATVTGERRAGGVQYTMSTTSGNTISSTTGTASTATSAHIYNWDNQETGTITSELTPATTFHTHANGYTGTDPTTVRSPSHPGFPRKPLSATQASNKSAFYRKNTRTRQHGKASTPSPATPTSASPRTE